MEGNYNQNLKCGMGLFSGQVASRQTEQAEQLGTRQAVAEHLVRLLCLIESKRRVY